MPTMSETSHPLSGRFLVFDGPDGSGKSTQVERFVQWCSDQGLEVKQVREPGGTLIGEQIREVLLNPENEGMTLPCEMLLYMASRAQLIKEEIIPAKGAGAVVVADRFVSATMVYQGYAGGLSVEWIKHVAEGAIQGCWPDLTLIFDLETAVARERLNPSLDRMELKGESFHSEIQKGFLALADESPDQYVIIDASQDIDSVESDVRKAIISRFM